MLVNCPGCTSRYKVPDSAAGKRTTCRKCGQAFRIPVTPPRPVPVAAAPEDDGLSLGDLDRLSGGAVVESHTAAAGSAERDVLFGAGGVLATAPPLRPEVAATPTRGYAGYVGAVARSFAFLGKGGNIMTFVILWIGLAIREIIQTALWNVPCIFLPMVTLGWIIITGWYIAYKLNVVVWAAGEDPDLPGLTNDEGWWDGILAPCLRMAATHIFAYLPVFLFAMTVVYRMAAAATQNPAAVLSGAEPVPGGAATAVLVLLAVLGTFIWPVLVLVVACGNNVFDFFRLDLILATIFKSLPAYILVVLSVSISYGLRAWIFGLAWSRLRTGVNWGDDWTAVVLMPTLLVSITLYFEIVAMRAIGYYYAYFKDRFAWSWG
ncbi:MAG: hypothetical protein AB1716_24430 [Planctomycetota bacterium]